MNLVRVPCNAAPWQTTQVINPPITSCACSGAVPLARGWAPVPLAQCVRVMQGQKSCREAAPDTPQYWCFVCRQAAL